MFNERNMRIEAAIAVLVSAVEHFKHSLDNDVYTDRWFESNRRAYHAMLKAKNELYDAIGGMEDYKYHIDED